MKYNRLLQGAERSGFSWINLADAYLIEKLLQKAISLPLWLGMEVKMIDEVCRVIESSKL